MKRDQDTIKVTMNYDQVWHLHELYESLHAGYEVDNAHELLLYGHIKEFRDKLGLLVDKEQNTYTYRLCGTEALAFVQVWKDAMKPLPIYQASIVQSIFNKIDQKRHQQKALSHG